MNELIKRCITEIRNKSEKNGIHGYDEQAPRNPSIIVNYNLEKESLDAYYVFLEQLWPSVYLNTPRANKDSDFEKIENEVRSNQLYSIFNEIHIHVLVNMTECIVDELRSFLKEKFDSPVYKLIVHEFLDYERKANNKKSEENLLSMMKEHDRVCYQLIYSNRLYNGAMWLGENSYKRIRLAANITALMSIDSHHFNNNNVYTFSYNLLEKPTKKIVQFTIRRLLENITDCPENPKLDQEILRRYRGSIQREVSYAMSPLLFKENDFKYLPDNKELHNEKDNTKKGIRSLELNYPMAYMCFNAMVKERLSTIGRTPVRSVDYFKELSGHLFTFYEIEGFLKSKRQKNDLLKSIKDTLLHEKMISDEGTYNKVLTEYANQVIEMDITRIKLADFSRQVSERVDHACDVYKWLVECQNSPELQINAIENELNLCVYYGKLVDDYFSSNKDGIIERLNKCTDKEEVLNHGLWDVLVDLFSSIPVYYMPFEDEIDVRVGKDTAKNMFEKISEKGSVESNICIDWTNLQFSLDKNNTGNILLLINPNSKLLNLKIDGNYESLKLSRQDCVERIDFHVLSLKKR